MSDVKQVKVDNWGIYFLQRLKHFFNRTDYCDLTLQFQDNAQLKVHRLVLSACTEYFEVLERTCEMYEDCLVMPDDLQADVVVPIVNFMYTGHLEFKMDLLERLYQTSQILNMPVLTKLLESHRQVTKLSTTQHSYSAKRKTVEAVKTAKQTTSTKRSYSKAFDTNIVYREKKVYQPHKIPEPNNSPISFGRSTSPSPLETTTSNRKSIFVDPRPTRYELPEELDNDNVFDNSFCNISYACKPLMIHPDNVKRYSSKRSGIFSEASSSKKLLPGTSTVDIVECKRINKNDNIFEDSMNDNNMGDELDIFNASYNNETPKDTNQLFDQILDDGPKVTIETKDTKAASNLDHAKIISEVLKKYPHLVKSNKNIKLKILNTPGKAKKPQKPHAASPNYVEVPAKQKIKTEDADYTYETDVIDSQQAAKLIALGAENTKGPWICLICGTPGKALHFTSYYKFRRHLVEVHNEKPVSNICEYCGLKSLKRNYLLHHLYAQHGVDPPPQYNFPKCNRCNYIALTEGLLVKHKMTHKDAKAFRCNVCSVPFSTTKQLLQHIQATGHKYSAERKTNLQCIYCLKSFLRDANLYAHLKTYHRKEARRDGVIEDSEDDEEKPTETITRTKVDNREKYHNIKYEPSTSYDNEYEEVDVQYQIQQRTDGDIQLTPRKQHTVISNQQHNVVSSPRQKILNPGFGPPKPAQKAKPVRKAAPEPNNFLEDMTMPSPPSANHNNEDEEIVLIDNIEYIMRDHQLIPRKSKPNSNNDYVIADMMDSASLQAVHTATPIEFTNVHNTKILDDGQSGVLMKKSSSINQPIQIVVSNEEEYKALMTSNHPILFDNSDANKTLTVLTAQHNATLQSATIDLDNTQSNDMMIIQNEFPLNVTEAVSSDNSNIVVVYSHPVDDQSKQYQILTTGGIGSQFVQSSAIITQNFETVTTTAPTINAHVLQTQADTTWQNNDPNTEGPQMHTDTATEQQTIESCALKPCENESSDILSDLPEVQLQQDSQTDLSQNAQDNVTISTLNVVIDSTSQVICTRSEQDIVEEPQNIPQPIVTQSESDIEKMQTESDIVEDDLIEHEATVATEAMEISQENEGIPEVMADDASQVNSQEPMETESIVEDSVIEATEVPPQEEQIIDTVAINENQFENEKPTVNVEQDNTLKDQQPLPESQAYDDIIKIDQQVSEVEQLPVKEAEEKIQNLTLEWSEDEYDVAEDVPATLEKVSATQEVVTTQLPVTELEETIENIQQEVLNHISSTTESVQPTENEITDTSVPDTVEEIEELEEPEEPQISPVSQSDVPVQNDPEAQEKISSLLNDWEDNDSQEENNTEEVENKSTDIDDNPQVIETNLQEIATITQDDNGSHDENNCDTAAVENASNGNAEQVPKPDSIKNLVSDWDEEEEEIKE